MFEQRGGDKKKQRQIEHRPVTEPGPVHSPHELARHLALASHYRNTSVLYRWNSQGI
jgi:hypothetical protein